MNPVFPSGAWGSVQRMKGVLAAKTTPGCLGHMTPKLKGTWSGEWMRKLRSRERVAWHLGHGGHYGCLLWLTGDTAAVKTVLTGACTPDRASTRAAARVLDGHAIDNTHD